MERPKKNGFTLIEVLAVMLIISVIAVMVNIDFNAFLAYARARASITELVTDIRCAQQMAIGEGRNYYIDLNRENDSYMIKVAAHPQAEIIKLVKLEGIIDILGTNFPDDEFYFTCLGAPSRGGEINIKDCRGKDYRITILPATGRVKVYY
jgi:prepilin-type N-terminal cleavage/methylation domain-containing protein